ncbi:unnamed protein product [Oppiella nova]|uniref:Uncharacterized protein n=1 Tax=Oppiella nova TaxID=334625 RepID=A0A7R9MCV5_9ACAR|nr:unnamed protein product [Oppiella nova]CAG2174968.1 unnamed protein product [Oppiella nova]
MVFGFYVNIRAFQFKINGLPCDLSVSVVTTVLSASGTDYLSGISVVVVIRSVVMPVLFGPNPTESRFSIEFFEIFSVLSTDL